MTALRPMAGKLAIDATAYDPSQMSGLARYTGGLLDLLLQANPKSIVYTTSEVLGRCYGDRARLVRPSLLAESGFRGNLLRTAWQQLWLRRTLVRDQASLYYSPIPEGMVAPPCKQVITIHDLIPLRFPAANPRLVYYYRYVLPRIVAASAAVITVSEATERDLRRYYHLSDKPIHVVYQGYRSEVFRPVPAVVVERTKLNYRLEEFVLAVGEMRSYKNLTRLLEAFARVPNRALKLVVVGHAGPRDLSLLDLPRNLGFEERVVFVGRIPDEELAALYAGAKALVFPSLYEGFGIPPLEAMACGCPVVASREASIPEVCGDAAVYVDPYDVDDIASGIQDIISDDDRRRCMSAKGMERARRFSYSAAADRIVQILYEGVV